MSGSLNIYVCAILEKLNNPPSSRIYNWSFLISIHLNCVRFEHDLIPAWRYWASLSVFVEVDRWTGRRPPGQGSSRKRERRSIVRRRRSTLWQCSPYRRSCRGERCRSTWTDPEFIIENILSESLYLRCLLWLTVKYGMISSISNFCYMN